MVFGLLLVDVIILVVLIALVIYIILMFNGFISLRNNIGKAWANIDVILKQRNDELPNLVETVKGYMKHEKETLFMLTKARTAWASATTLNKKAAVSNVITDAVKSIFAVAENYPTLKANENFLKLQERISGLENEIADRREFYNESVTRYNTRTQSFPDLILAGIFGFKPAEWFKATEEEKQQVKASF